MNRNGIIFINKEIQQPISIAQIINAFHEILDDEHTPTVQTVMPEAINRNQTWAYFDGSTQEQGLGGGGLGGILLHLSDNHYYHVQMGLGVGNNNFAELISLRHLLHFALAHECRHLQIFGDSKIIINWFNNTFSCHVHSLRNIFDDAMHLK